MQLKVQIGTFLHDLNYLLGYTGCNTSVFDFSVYRGTSIEWLYVCSILGLHTLDHKLKKPKWVKGLCISKKLRKCVQQCTNHSLLEWWLNLQPHFKHILALPNHDLKFLSNKLLKSKLKMEHHKSRLHMQMNLKVFPIW